MPEEPPNPAIAGLPNHIPDGSSMIVAGVPTLPVGCTAPQLIEKHDRTIYKASFASALRSKDTGFSEIISGGFAEADIIIDSHGQSGGDDATWIQIKDPLMPRSQALERLLSANLESWGWKTSSLQRLDAAGHGPTIVGLEMNSLYTVYAMARVRYEFHQLPNGTVAVTSTITLGDSVVGCKRLRLATAPEPIRAVVGMTAKYLICAVPHI
jgi:hypothetical protein